MMIFENNSQTPEAEVVWARYQIVRAGKDHTAENSTSRKGARQTEEEMGGQYKGVDRITSERYLEESRES